MPSTKIFAHPVTNNISTFFEFWTFGTFVPNLSQIGEGSNYAILSIFFPLLAFLKQVRENSG